MDLLEYSHKVVQAELTWISRHTSGNPPWSRRVLLRVKWLMRNFSYKVIGRRRRPTGAPAFGYARRALAELSQTRCVEGENWGTNRAGV